MLLQPLTQEEVSEAVKQLPAGKAPGIDTIPAEFYQESWDEVQFDIFNFVSESISQEGIAEELNVSKIALLPKSEDRLRVQNYRPISLLNTLYKVVAKVYANRMKPLLHNWILPSRLASSRIGAFLTMSSSPLKRWSGPLRTNKSSLCYCWTSRKLMRESIGCFLNGRCKLWDFRRSGLTRSCHST